MRSVHITIYFSSQPAAQNIISHLKLFYNVQGQGKANKKKLFKELEDVSKTNMCIGHRITLISIIVNLLNTSYT